MSDTTEVSGEIQDRRLNLSEGPKAGGKPGKPSKEEQAAAAAIVAAETRKVPVPLDFTKPFALVVDQTESRTNYQVFQNGTVEENRAEAIAYAAKIALTTGRAAAYFDHQSGVKTAPVMAADMELEFLKPTRSAE